MDAYIDSDGTIVSPFGYPDCGYSKYIDITDRKTNTLKLYCAQLSFLIHVYDS